MNTFWADTPQRVLYCLLATADVFDTPSRALMVMTIRNELHRRGLPLVGPGCVCATGGHCTAPDGVSGLDDP